MHLNHAAKDSWGSLGTAWRSNQSILKEINPEFSLEGLMLKLKLRYFATWEEPIHWKRPWCWVRLRIGGEGGDRAWDGRMALPNQWTWVWANSGRQWSTWRPGLLQSMGSHSWTQLSVWTTTTRYKRNALQDFITKKKSFQSSEDDFFYVNKTIPPKKDEDQLFIFKVLEIIS